MVRKIRKKDEDSAAGSDDIASNEDLITLILLFLPVKSLLRFKLVSKSWLSLITSTHFSDLKRKRFSKHISGLFLRRVYRRPNFNPKYEFIPLDEDGNRSVAHRTRGISPMTRPNFVHTEGKIDVLQSCNGLLLCRDSSGAHHECKYYVFNPTTKEYTVAPVNRALNSGIIDPVLFVNLAFDPTKSPHYKLICLYYSQSFMPTGPKCFDLGIYSSETGVLRQIDCYLSWIEPEYREGVYWNGAVNWIDHTCDGLYFNVDEEWLGTFPMPPISQEGTPRPVARYYGESNDRLHLILTVSCLITKFDVYEMKKDYSGWFVRFRVDLQPVLDSFPGANIPHFGVLGVVRKDEDQKSFLVLSIPCKVIKFCFEDGSFSKLCDFASTNDSVYDWRLSFQFIGSLHRM